MDLANSSTPKPEKRSHPSCPSFGLTIHGTCQPTGPNSASPDGPEPANERSAENFSLSRHWRKAPANGQARSPLAMVSSLLAMASKLEAIA